VYTVVIPNCGISINSTRLVQTYPVPVLTPAKLIPVGLFLIGGPTYDFLLFASIENTKPEVTVDGD
jgi:hypothetical protein